MRQLCNFGIKKCLVYSLTAICFMLILSSYKKSGGTINETADKYYSKLIKQLKGSLGQFQVQCKSQPGLAAMKASFIRSRLVYKQLAVLTEYYNPYETKNLNGPAIDRIESEVADRIIAPQGFQAIEQLLYGEPWSVAQYKVVNTLLSDMQRILEKLETEPDRKFKFSEPLIWDAARAAIIQLTTGGITGFDSPVANLSLKEGQATVTGIKNLLQIISAHNDAAKGGLTNLEKLLDKAAAQLSANTAFNQFDRLSFISRHINPIYSELVNARIRSGVSAPEGRSAVNYDVPSLFDENFFNVNFYSPPQEYWVNENRVVLGKKLFNDPVLSGPHSRSCATCHKPELAFTDGLAKPYALDNKTLLPRNTPTLWNSGYQTRQFMDSRSDLLENQLTEVVHNLQEMDGSLRKSVGELRRDSIYTSLFKTAYPSEREPVSAFTIANAISSYVRSLRSLNSRFDQYMRGNKQALNASEKNGFNLFAGKAKCATCHFIPLFNGVVPPFFAETESEVVGVPKTKNKKGAVIDEDEGKYHFTRALIHKYSFKTPTLRNIALTAPYMHNGVYDSLEEVMEFYNNGGGKGLHIAPPNQTLPFDKLQLNKKEISDIIQFMKSLTDTSTKRHVY